MFHKREHILPKEGNLLPTYKGTCFPHGREYISPIEGNIVYPIEKRMMAFSSGSSQSDADQTSSGGKGEDWSKYITVGDLGGFKVGPHHVSLFSLFCKNISQTQNRNLPALWTRLMIQNGSEG